MAYRRVLATGTSISLRIEQEPSGFCQLLGDLFLRAIRGSPSHIALKFLGCVFTNTPFVAHLRLGWDRLCCVSSGSSMSTWANESFAAKTDRSALC